jgi:hypothetical protein
MNNIEYATHIKVREPAERRYWCEQLGCTEGMLFALIVNVGSKAEDVRRAAGRMFAIDKLRDPRRF